MKRLNKIKLKYAIIFFALCVVLFLTIIPTFMRYKYEVTANVVGYAKETRQSTYTVKFHSNGGTGTMADMVVTYNVAQNLTKNVFTNGSYNFSGWNTEVDGSGTNYTDEQEINSAAYIAGNEINLYAQWVSGIAEVNGLFYPSLQAAVDAVTTSTPTTVKLLANTEEQITVSNTQNIIFNLQNYTVSRNSGKDGVIENHGIVSIINGTLTSSVDGAVINNYKGATLYISGGNLIGTFTQKGQAIYNKGGTVEISGNAFLSSNSTNRATVHNLADGTDKGTVIITGGTIISNGFSAVINDKNSIPIVIGTNDGTVDKTTPVIQGATYGLDRVTSGSFEFYDGIIKGKNKAINNENTIVTAHETGFDIAHVEEIINGQTYKTAYLAITNVVTFNAQGGTSSESTRYVENGCAIGTLPIPVKPGYSFDGWFTLSEGGQQISASTIVTSDITYFAHWTQTDVAEINGVTYPTIQAALNTITDSTPTTITIISNTSEAVTVSANKNIIFDLQNYTISNNGNHAVIDNFGTVSISNGTITSNADTATINNKNGATLLVSGGNIISTGTRSAIWNETANLEISGTAYLSSTATGKPDNSTLDRGTVHNTHGTVTITGGTIVAVNQHGVSNEGTVVIGTKDGNINTSTPLIKGEVYGVVNRGTFNFYDGIIKGINDTIDGNISEQETNSQLVNGTETIDNKTYATVYLEIP